MPEPENSVVERKRRDWREFVAVLLLSVTAIVTAWTGLQSAKWRGEMSISFSQASSARLEAGRQDGTANQKLTVQVTLFTQWLDAYQNGDEKLCTFLQARFPEPLKAAFPVWLASEPLKNPNAAPTPFSQPDFVIPESTAAKAADAKADAKFDQALIYNDRADEYPVLTVGLATVLFFAAMSGRMHHRRTQWALLALAGVGFLLCTGLLISFPKLV